MSRMTTYHNGYGEKVMQAAGRRKGPGSAARSLRKDHSGQPADAFILEGKGDREGRKQGTMAQPQGLALWIPLQSLAGLVGKGGARDPKIGMRAPVHVFLSAPQEASSHPTIMACVFFCITLSVFSGL